MSPRRLNSEDLDGNEDSEWLDLGIVDVEAETESMRQEAEDRLRLQSNEIKRFHEKICARVTQRERQNRLEAQRAQKHLVLKHLISSTIME
ncbi:Peptidase P60 [Phytophthora palmivora]|uniref:Peptidase P60 n=1 Tax=Phytophthora palmivora TaxID=4796 RepID=A0A2P4XMG1_9STRA|nr:Peptidase P60 [Phytophthora palmivora]